MPVVKYSWDAQSRKSKQVLIVTSIACYRGYYCHSSAKGVGASTTQAVVLSCVFILLADLILALALL